MIVERAGERASMLRSDGGERRRELWDVERGTWNLCIPLVTTTAQQGILLFFLERVYPFH